jgi:hypothetical protein
VADNFDEFEVVGDTGTGEDFSQFDAVDPTPGQKITTVGQGVTGGLVESASAAGGMIMGAQIGALGGFAAPVTIPLGAAIGFGAGYFGGKGIRKGLSEVETPQGNTLTFNSVDDVDPSLRPYAVAGEVVGGSVPFSAMPNLAARLGYRLPPSKVGNFFNRIIDFAAKNPGTAATAETVASVGSGVGGGVAENFAPGEEGTRFAGEMAGGFLNPQRLIINSTSLGLQAARRAVESMTAAGKQTAAGRIIQEIVAASGEDADVLARTLSDPAITGLTAAQGSGSPALIALESNLAKASGAFDAETAKRAQQGLDATKAAIDLLLRTGDPVAFREAAAMRSRYFGTLISTRLVEAENRATQAVGKITKDNPGDMGAISKRAFESMDAALVEVRKAESELWLKVPTDVPAGTKNIVSKFDELKTQILPEESLPKIAEDFIARVREGATTTGELQLFRSRMLALAREAGAQGKHNDARIYGNLAETALDDIDGAFKGPNSGVLRAFGDDTEAYDAARAFSRELNEKFTQTFAGQAMASTSKGGDRIPPELMMRRAMAGGKEAAELRLREIEEATGFLSAQGLDTPEAGLNFTNMLDAQQRVVRLAAAQTIDPNTGRVSATRLARFIENNDAILKKFPEVRADLVEAVSSENARRGMEQAAGLANRVIERRAAFAAVARTENPAKVVREAINGATPSSDIRALAKVARRGGPGAEAGFRASVMDYAFEAASKGDGSIDFTKLKIAMFGEVAPGQSSLVQTLVQEGVFSRQDVKKLASFIKRAENIEKAARGGKGVDSFMKDADGLFDLVMRIAGARAGAAMASGSGGASLIAASRGSSFVRKMFDKVPQAKVTSIIKEAALNPKLMAALLEKPVSQRDQIMLARQINGFLFQAGINLAEDDQ